MNIDQAYEEARMIAKKEGCEICGEIPTVSVTWVHGAVVAEFYCPRCDETWEIELVEESEAGIRY